MLIHCSFFYKKTIFYDYSTKYRNKKLNYLAYDEDIPLSLQVSLDGKKFLKFDNGIKNKQRFIVFYVKILRNM